MVRKAHRLRHLHMGVAGQDGVDVTFGHVDERGLHLHQRCVQRVDLAAQPQAHVGGHLVIAAAPGVQALAGVAHQLG